MTAQLKNILLKLTLLVGLGFGRVEQYARTEVRRLLIHRIVFPLCPEPPQEPADDAGPAWSDRVVLHRFRPVTRSWEPITLAERNRLRVNDLVRLPLHGFIAATKEQIFHTDEDNFIFWRVADMRDVDGDGIPQLIVKPIQWISRRSH